MKPFCKIYKETTLVLGLLLFFISVSCGSNHMPKNIVVADAIRLLRQELPFRLDGFGMVQNVDYEDNTILFQLRIYEDATYGLNVNKINSKQTLAKEIVSAQIGMMSNQRKNAMKNIAEQSYGLRIVLNGSNSNQGIINLTPDEIKAAISNTSNKTPEDISLEIVALTTKLILPARVNQITTWNDTRITDTSFEYVYYIDDEDIDLNSLDLNILKKEKLSMIRQNADAMRTIVRHCKSTRRNLIFTMIGNHSNKTVNLVLTPNDLEPIEL